jgi:ribulose-phosphate 3-epimerase
MIEKPEDYLRAFVDAGADAISIHAEATAYLVHALLQIKGLGAAAGIAINPGTGVSAVEPLRDMIDYALVMTVNPGFGGQAMIETALDKVGVLRQMLPEHVAIEVDGGVHERNIRRVVQLGGNWVVAGSAVFDAKDPGEQVCRLQAEMTLRGRVRFPTGGDSPRALRGRPGQIPGPTVKVWKREDKSEAG